MNRKSFFYKIHALIIVFYTVMYTTGIFHTDDNWDIPIKHPYFGTMGLVVIVVYLLSNKDKKIVFNIIKYNINLNLKKGKSVQKLFKVSVLLLLTNLFTSVFTGILPFSSLISNESLYSLIFRIHSSSRYVLILLIILHVISRYLRKYMSKNH